MIDYKLSNGYAYRLENNEDWKQSDNESWEIVVIGDKEISSHSYVGKRLIDMVMCNVFETPSHNYLAQKSY